MDLLRVMVKGGVLSPRELMRIVEMAEAYGLETVHFGSRMDILFPDTEMNDEILQEYPGLNLERITDKKHQNIVSSYVSADILSATYWLSGASYLYILEQFSYKPILEINIVDPKQQLVPVFSGQLNFIASEEEDYWYLYIRLPHWEEVQCYPVLIFSWDIAKVAKVIETVYQECNDITDLFEEVNNEVDTNSRTIQAPLKIPYNIFPYYEGMNKMSIDQYWLGLYWRNNRYDLGFLKKMCDLCLKSKIGKICLTPWKSFIIKGIHKQEKLEWEKFLGSSGINVRHSLLEMNWHLPVADDEALELKKFLVRNFDQNDISTYGLTFGVSSHYGVNFTTIVIEKNPVPAIAKGYDIRPTYNILYAEDFDPNRLKYLTYARDIDKIELPGLLMELTRIYFDQLGENQEKEESSYEKSTVDESTEKTLVYQCKACMTVYDAKYGDPAQGVEKGTLFHQLPINYKCATCDAPKNSFVKTEMKLMA